MLAIVVVRVVGSVIVYDILSGWTPYHLYDQFVAKTIVSISIFNLHVRFFLLTVFVTSCMIVFRDMKIFLNVVFSSILCVYSDVLLVLSLEFCTRCC